MKQAEVNTHTHRQTYFRLIGFACVRFEIRLKAVRHDYQFLLLFPEPITLAADADGGGRRGVASQSQATPIDNRADNASFWRVELNRVGMPREVGRQNEAHSQDNAVLLAWSAYLFAASAGGILGLNVTPGPEKHTVEATVEELEVELAERMQGSLLRGEWRAACGVLRAAGEIPGALFRFHCQDNGQRDMRQWPLAVAARPHRCRNQLHAAILGTSRGSSNRRKRRRRRWRCRRNSRSRRSGGIRKKDIVCCNIVMTLTMATAPPAQVATR